MNYVIIMMMMMMIYSVHMEPYFLFHFFLKKNIQRCNRWEIKEPLYEDTTFDEYKHIVALSGCLFSGLLLLSSK